MEVYKKITTLLILVLFLGIALTFELQLEDAQFKRLISKHFVDFKESSVHGIHIFKKERNVSIQVDIRTSNENLRKTIYRTYKSLYNLSSHYFQELENFHIIYHFENNAVPLTTSANRECLERFFIKHDENFSNWENNCLNIGSL